MQNKHNTLLLVAALLCALVGTALAPQTAEACGGLFCNNGSPVNQMAERIVFVDHPDDTVTAIVEILYDGPAESFSWLVPVPGIPVIGLSSTSFLDNLQQRTNPTYTLQTTFDESCDDIPVPNQNANDVNNVSEGNNGDGGGGVQVIASGSLGPYIYEVIEVDESVGNREALAVDWLEDNGYDVAGPEILREYLDAGMNILGFKLNKTASTGSIRPVTMTYEAATPMIPIKLTAVAANDDMGVLTWVLSENRALPTNYRNLILNEAALDWFNPNSNYNELVIRAADEAGGQGFVTEASGTVVSPDEAEAQGILSDPSIFIFSAPWAYRVWDEDEASEHQVLFESIQRFGDWDGTVDVVQSAVPLPEGVSASDFIANSWNYESDPAYAQEDIEGFEPDVFAQMMEDMVIAPVEDSYELLLSRPYMTRFYTTLSPSEMTLDPIFEYNADLPDISNRHTANRVISCDEQGNRTWVTTLENGLTVSGEGSSWPTMASALPANQIVQQLSSSAGPETITDNTSAIESTLGSMVTPDLGDGDSEAPKGNKIDDGGCTTAPGSSPTLPIFLVLGGFFLFLRRKR